MIQLFFSTVRSRLVSLAAVAQARFNLRSPSAQAPSLPSSDGLIMTVAEQLSCCIFLVNFRRGAWVPSFGTQGRRNGNLLRLYIHTTVRSGPSTSEHVGDVVFPP